MGYTNIGSSPLDKIADIAGAIAQGRAKAQKRKREIERKIKSAPKNLANAVLDSVAEKAGVTRGLCKHKGVKRGQICSGCGAKLF